MSLKTCAEVVEAAEALAMELQQELHQELQPLDLLLHPQLPGLARLTQ